MAASPPHHQSGRRHATMTNHTPSLLRQDSDGASSPVSDEEAKPRQLLDLPSEILNAILKEVSRLFHSSIGAYRLTCRRNS